MTEHSGRIDDDLLRRHGWKLIALASTLVIVWSTLRGVSSGYVLVGDNAYFELLARDVGTAHHPLLGTWSSASISSGVDVNHPGPLIFDVLAVPVRLFGGAAGVAIGSAILNIAMVWLAGIAAFRAGGATAAIAAQMITAVLVWTLGSELLYDPWQPNILVLVFWVLLLLVWAIVADSIWMFPIACGVGSFAMQTHLGYLFLVPVLLGFGAGVVFDRRRRGGALGELTAPALWSVGVIVVLWAQPLYEQFFGFGRGNLSRIVVAGTGGGDLERVESTRTGLSLGVRILGAVWALPPWWGRPGFDDSIPPSQWIDTPDGRVLSAPGLSAGVPAAVGLVVMVLVLSAAWWAARTAGARQVDYGFWVLTLAMSMAVITVLVVPIDILGLSPHKVRYLWVIGAYATLMIVMAALAWCSAEQRRIGLGAVGVVAAVVLVASLPTHANRSGPVFFEVTYDSVDDLRSQLGDYLETNEVDEVLFDDEGIGFAEPYTVPVMAELQESGVDIFVDDVQLARHLGRERLADLDDPYDGGGRPLVFVRAGQAAADTPDGAVRIAFHDGDRTPYSIVDVTDRAVAVFLVPDGASFDRESGV